MFGLDVDDMMRFTVLYAGSLVAGLLVACIRRVPELVAVQLFVPLAILDVLFLVVVISGEWP